MNTLLHVILAITPAQPVVVVRADLSATDAARQVARDSVLTESDLDPVTLTGLAGGRPPFVVGDGHVIPCGRAPTTAEAVARDADEALRLLVRLDHQAARDALEEALQELGCQKDRVSPETSARLYYLSGLVRIDQQWPDKARDDFAQALVYSPELTWDARFDPAEGNGAQLLEEARKRVADSVPADLSIVPGGEELTITVDGAVVTQMPISLRPGEHVVQLQGATTTTVRTWLKPGGQATLAVPGLLEESHAYALTDSETQGPVRTTLDPSLAPDTDLWLATPSGTWRQDEGGTMTLVAAHKPRTREYVRSNAWLSGSGGVALLGAGAWALVERSLATQAALEANGAPSYAAWTAADSRFDVHQSRYRIALGATAAGATVALFGASVPLGRTQYGGGAR